MTPERELVLLAAMVRAADLSEHLTDIDRKWSAAEPRGPLELERSLVGIPGLERWRAEVLSDEVGRLEDLIRQEADLNLDLRDAVALVIRLHPPERAEDRAGWEDILAMVDKELRDAAEALGAPGALR